MVCEIDDDKMSRTADAVIADLAAIIGWPSAIIDSGHRQHFYWPVINLMPRRFRMAQRLPGQAFRHPGEEGRGGWRGLVDPCPTGACCGYRYHEPQAESLSRLRCMAIAIGAACRLHVADVLAVLEAQQIPDVDETEAARDVVCPPADWGYTRPASISRVSGWRTEIDRGSPMRSTTIGTSGCCRKRSSWRVPTGTAASAAKTTITMW